MDFFNWIPLNESFQNCYSRFFLSLTVFEIQGSQKGKNAILEATSKFYFSSNFDGIFFIGFLSMRTFLFSAANFFYPVPFSRYKGPIRTKNYFQWNLNLLPYHISKTHYCVQYITVSNTLLCQASTRIIFILMYSSVVNMLRSYHAALAKPLSFILKTSEEFYIKV